METLSKMVAIVILILFVFFVPTFIYSENADAVTQQAVQSYTVSFVEAIKKQGKITQSMYNQFLAELEATGHSYDVDFTHSHTYTQPIFEGTTVKDTAEFEDHYYTSDIINTLFARKLSEAELAAGNVQGEYHFKKGDYLTVEVSNNDYTYAGYLRSIFYGRSNTLKRSIHVIYGGTIEDENY